MGFVKEIKEDIARTPKFDLNPFLFKAFSRGHQPGCYEAKRLGGLEAGQVDSRQ